MATTRSSRLAAGVFAAGLLLVPIAGCSTDVEDPTAQLSDAEQSARSATESAESAASSAAGEVNQRVDCSGNSCTVTVGTGADVELLGNTLSLESVQDGQATMSVGDRTVTCGEGEDVNVGPLSVTCSEISDDSVTMEASLG